MQSSRKRKYKHLVIPDCQVKDGVPLEHLAWAGKYAAAKKPDVIVCIGDFADMPSLSSYDLGKKSYEGRTYSKDIEVARYAMSLLLDPINEERKDYSNNGGERPSWNPKLVFTYGNHEQGRIDKAIQSDRKLERLISVDDLGYREMGWETVPYLEVRTIHGISYSHYFTSGVLDRPVTSARALLTKRHCSAIMGHVQRRDIAYDYTAEGKQITGIFCGSFYQHDEDYMSKQGNKHWRGIWMLHNVCGGEFDECPIPLEYLRQKFFKEK
jgi:hypothetical protein